MPFRASLGGKCFSRCQPSSRLLSGLPLEESGHRWTLTRSAVRTPLKETAEPVLGSLGEHSGETMVAFLASRRSSFGGRGC